MNASLIEKLREAIVMGNIEEAREYAKKALDSNLDPLKVINEGISKGLKEVGDKFGKSELFLTDLIMAGEAAKAASETLLPKIGSKKTGKSMGKIVIGTVKGDIHSIGKDIVATLLEAEGFEVINLGEDVPTEKFVEAVKKYSPDIVGLSALLTVTRPVQREVIEALKKANLRDKVKIMIGGAPTTNEWANEIGADGWAGDAISAISVAKKLISKRNNAS